MDLSVSWCRCIQLFITFLLSHCGALKGTMPFTPDQKKKQKQDRNNGNKCSCISQFTVGHRKLDLSIFILLLFLLLFNNQSLSFMIFTDISTKCSIYEDKSSNVQVV